VVMLFWYESFLCERSSIGRKQPMKKNDVPLTSVTLSDLELNQEGKLTITFDIPTRQQSTHYEITKSGSRILDVYDHKELLDLSKKLFKAAKKIMLAQADPDLESVDCNKCKEATCCRDYNVLLSDEDIERLREKTPRHVFLKEYTDPGIDWAGEYESQLKCDEDEVGEKCIFLKRDHLGQMRCSIYESRPQICRDFDMSVCSDFDSVEEENE
jgi:Fe-S-cluster containining protein